MIAKNEVICRIIGMIMSDRTKQNSSKTFPEVTITFNGLKGHSMTGSKTIDCSQQIKGSIELTHGSPCNGVWKLQSMNVLKLLSTNLKAD